MDCAFPRLHVVTDTRPGRDPLRVVRAAVAAVVRLELTGLLAVQVRVAYDATDRQAYDLALAVLSVCRPAGVLCLVNDRLHVALGVGADGGHVGADDLPVAAARRVLGGGHPTMPGTAAGTPAATRAAAMRATVWRAAVLGVTCREPAGAREAVAAGATYLGVGPSFATATKSGLPDPIGPAGVGAVARAVPEVPVIAIGGVGVASVPVLLAAGAHGVAVVGALSGADSPDHVTIAFIRALQAPPRPGQDPGQRIGPGGGRETGPDGGAGRRVDRRGDGASPAAVPA